MSLHKKILLFIGSTYLILVILLLITANFFLLNHFAELEQQTARQDVSRFFNALDNDLNTLQKEASDWGCWDDTYDFVATNAAEYIESNLQDDTFQQLQLNFMFFINSKGYPEFQRVYDLNTNTRIENSPILAQINSKLLLLHDAYQHAQCGIFYESGQSLLVASQPILKSDRTGPSRGVLVIGRFLNQSELQRLGQLTRLQVELIPYANTFQNQVSFHPNDPIIVRVAGPNLINAYGRIQDIMGNPVLIVKLNLERSIYQQGQNSISYFTIAMISIGFILLAMTWLFWERVILKRLGCINQSMKRIATNNDLSLRTPLSGNDELTDLARGLNQMVDNLQSSYEQVEENRQKLLDIIEFFPDATLVIDGQHKVVAWNRAMEILTNTPKSDVLGREDYAYAVPFYGNPRPLLIDYIDTDPSELSGNYNNVEKIGAVLYAEVKIPAFQGGDDTWLWISASPLYNKQGETVGAIETVRDISPRKKTEDQLKYLSLHDALTGLYNRAYFEEELRRLEEIRMQSVGIIVCDVNGLKPINDTMGHSAGDRLLMALTTVLKDSFRSSDVVARIGGDEFSVIIAEGTAEILETAEKRIRGQIISYNINNPELPLSISIGWSFRSDPDVPLKKVYEDADNNMYHEKIHYTQSARSAIVLTLVKTLSVRDYLTEGHAERMKMLISVLAKNLGLADRRINDLIAFAQFHDIGKICIPDKILFKPGPLTAEEEEIMNGHSKIGYSIAQTAPELLHIADWILLHHERWDGKGYPQGLRGEAIPLECRILSIVDAYDAMTSDRPYHKALSNQDAVAELRKCAGTQFDPALVEEFVAIVNGGNGDFTLDVFDPPPHQKDVAN